MGKIKLPLVWIVVWLSADVQRGVNHVQIYTNRKPIVREQPQEGVRPALIRVWTIVKYVVNIPANLRCIILMGIQLIITQVTT